MKIKHCRHQKIKEFCVKCTKPRKTNGQFKYSLEKRILNNIFVTLGIITIAVSGYFYLTNQPEQELLSPTFEVEAKEIPTPTINPIEAEIREVFGEYGDEAVQIARCESKLDPKAVNDNRTWGGKGVDRGVFQINSYYHKADVKFYFDYKTNIAMGYKIFKDAGYKWTPWTCRWIFNK